MSVQINGTNGLTFSDGSSQQTAASGFGFKNRIINGAMQVWQRGTSFSSGVGAATYTADRFFVFATGAAVAVDKIAGIGGFSNALRITGAAGNTTAQVYHRIESLNCSDLSGATVTISVTLSSSANQTVSWALAHPTASDNYASTTNISSGTWAVTSTANTFTATVTSLPAGALNGLQLIIGANQFGAFTSGTLTITGVQLEKGSTATSFDYRPYGQELALCQRYFESGASGSVVYNANQFSSAQYKVSKRSSPTVSISPASGTMAFITTDICGFYAQCSATAGATWTATAEL